MKTKRVLGLLLCVVFLVTVFSACGGQAQNAASTTAATSAQTTAAVTAAAAEPVTIVMERPLWGGDPASAPNMRIREAIKKKLNIDVQVVGQLNPQDQNEKPNLMLASGEQLDIFQTGFDPSNYYDKYKKQDAIIPLNDLIDKYGQNLKKAVDPNSFKLLTDKDGKIWGLPDESNPVTVCLMIRQDLLDKYQLAKPVTFEDYENVLQTLKDKEKDEGFVGLYGDSSLDLCFAGSFMPVAGGVDTKYLDSDGKLKPNYLHPGYKDFLAKMQDWYKKGYIHKEIATLQYQQASDIIASGKSALFVDWVSGGFGVEAEGIGLLKNVPNAKLSIVVPPKGTETGKVVAGSPVSCNIMITKSSKYPDLAMKFLDWSQATDEGWLLTKYGEEGIDWNWLDKSKNLLKYTDKKPEEERYGYPIFCSTRLNSFVNKYSVDTTESNDATAFMSDSAKYPSVFPPDAFTMYDLAKFKSKDLMNSLQTYIQQERSRIIMGQKPVSEWDNVIKKWLADGGQQLIDDYTEQYNASK